MKYRLDLICPHGIMQSRKCVGEKCALWYIYHKGKGKYGACGLHQKCGENGTYRMRYEDGD